MNEERYRMIEEPAPLKRIKAGDHFSDQVLVRLAEESQQASGVTGYLRTHSHIMMLVLLILFNTLSIIIGIRSIGGMAAETNNQDQDVAEVYFIDPSASQLYTYLK